MTSDSEQVRRATLETVGDREIRIERLFDAPREAVWEAFTDPALIPEWWGPRDQIAQVDTMDVRPGGAWRFTSPTSDGQTTGFRGEYREVVAPERLVQTFEWEGMPGHVAVETMTLEDLGDQTRMVVTSVFPGPEDRDGMLASGMERGMQETYQRLDEVLAARA